MANPANYRSRSAFKLLEMDAKYKFLERPRPSCFSHPRIIVDLGASPGGWSQVVALKMGYAEIFKGEDPLRPTNEPFETTNYGLKPSARVESRGTWSDRVAEDPTLPRSGDGAYNNTHVKIIALDLVRLHPIRGVISIQTDFLSPTATDLVKAHFPENAPERGVDVILSDMAANTTGNSIVDVENSLKICTAVLEFAHRHLSVKNGSEPGGVLVLKHFMHPTMHEFRNIHLNNSFRRVIFAKPPSSRSESTEGYWICIDWLGRHPPSLGTRLSKLRESSQTTSEGSKW